MRLVIVNNAFLYIHGIISQRAPIFKLKLSSKTKKYGIPKKLINSKK